MYKILFSGYVNPTNNGCNFNVVLIKNNEYNKTKSILDTIQVSVLRAK